VLRFLEVPIASITFFQNWEVNKDPQSDMMLLGGLWTCTTYMRNLATSALEPIVSLHTMKCAILVRRSTITYIVFIPLSSGRPVIKSMQMDSHSLSRICKGHMRLKGACLMGLIYL
jgi:hypothetical protein